MKKIEFEGIDVTKALLFVILALFTAIVMTALVVVPGVREYKIQKIQTDRAFDQLRYAKNSYTRTVAEYNELLETNRPVVDSLLTRYDRERFVRHAGADLKKLKVADSPAVPWRDHFNLRELNVSTRLEKLEDFYDFSKHLNGYEGLAEMDFPVEIKANPDYSLDLAFKIRVYTLREKAPEKLKVELVD